jgi:hypothetical protein
VLESQRRAKISQAREALSAAEQSGDSQRTGSQGVVKSLRVLDGNQPTNLVARNDPRIESVLLRLQESETKRISGHKEIYRDGETHHFFDISPMPVEERSSLLGMVNAMPGNLVDPTGEIVPWADHVRRYYGLDDSFARSVVVSFQDDSSVVDFLITQIINSETSGEGVGGAVYFDSTKSEKWRFSHVVEMEADENEIRHEIR